MYYLKRKITLTERDSILEIQFFENNWNEFDENQIIIKKNK